jgi:ABC-type oligopeptide transport system ATPase subunit
LSSPKQAYTKRLISAIPSLNPQDKTFEKFTEKCSVI